MSLPAAIGLMSGTSLDGVDAALLRSDGLAVERGGPALTLPYDDAMRAALRSCRGGGGDVLAAERALTLRHGEAVAALLARAGLAAGDVRAIGFHGHTVVHRPAAGLTWQIGDGALLAQLTGIDVVADFRRADMAAGGQGAPLAPLYHAALARAQGGGGPLAVLNIGGVANVTWIDGGDLLAFDTGPGGALLDDWMRARRGQPFDRDGRAAAAGRAASGRVAALLGGHPYFARPPPKSLDRDAFAPDLCGLSTEDGAATLVALTAAAVARAAEHMPAPPRRWIVAGGGRRNRALIAALADGLAGEVAVAEEAGWDGDALEAEAFAYLALRALAGLPLSLPQTTGCREAVSGGALHRAPGRRP